MIFADVILDISTSALDRPFSYIVPEGLDIKVGDRVSVPFGNGSRKVSGYVTVVYDTPKYDIDRLKSIEKKDDGNIAIESRLIALAAWMHDRFGGAMSASLHTVLPVKTKVKNRIKKFYTLAVSMDEAKRLLAEFESRHYTAKLRLMAALMDNGTVEYELLKDRLKITKPVIDGFLEAGYIYETKETDYRNPVKDMISRSNPGVIDKWQEVV